MARLVHNVPIKEAMRKHATLTVNITGMRRYRVRLWIAGQLCRLAAWIACCGIEFKDDDVPRGTS